MTHHSSSTDLMNQLHSMLAATTQPILTATLYYTHSLLSEKTQLSTHERCVLERVSTWSPEVGKPTAQKDGASKEAVQLRIARFVEESFSLDVKANSTAAYCEGTVILRDVFGLDGERAALVVQRYIQQRQRLTERLECDAQPSKGTMNGLRSTKLTREMIAKIVAESRTIWGETIGKILPLHSAPTKSLHLDEEEANEEADSVWTDAGLLSMHCDNKTVLLEEAFRKLGRQGMRVHDQDHSYDGETVPATRFLEGPRTHSRNADIQSRKAITVTPPDPSLALSLTNTVIRTRPRQPRINAAIIANQKPVSAEAQEAISSLAEAFAA